MNKRIYGIFTICNGTDSEWNESNPILEQGEIGFNSTFNKIKVGDGKSVWTKLTYVVSSLDYKNLTASVVKVSSIPGTNVTNVQNALEELFSKSINLDNNYHLLDEKKLDKENIKATVEDFGVFNNKNNVEIKKTFYNANTKEEAYESSFIDLATENQAGAMSPSDIKQIKANKEAIALLQNDSIRLLYTEKENPSKEEIDSFVKNKGYKEPFTGVSVVVDQTFNIWHYYINDNIGWKNDGIDTVVQFTNDTAGIIKGSDTAGKVYAETDGTGSVKGWDVETAKIASNTDKIKTHIENKTNPHKVTAEQVNTYDKGTIDSKLGEKANASNVDDEIKKLMPKAGGTFTGEVSFNSDALKADTISTIAGVSNTGVLIKETKESLLKDTNTKIYTKADTSYVDNQLKLKLDKSTMPSLGALDADKIVAVDSTGKKYSLKTMVQVLFSETPNKDKNLVSQKAIEDAIISKIDELGTIFNFKGSKDSYDKLPTENNKAGDVWYVKDEQVGYIWMGDPDNRWEQLGLPLDGYYSKDETDNLLNAKADKEYVDNELSKKQNSLTEDQLKNIEDVTKKEDTTEVDRKIKEISLTPGPRGYDFEYNWKGTELGVKNSSQQEYQYTNLKGDQGIQGWAFCAQVKRDSFTQAQWETYGAKDHKELWINTSDIRNGCRINDLFVVVGTSTDTGRSYFLTYKSTTSSGDLNGICIGSSYSERGAQGIQGPPGLLPPSVKVKKISMDKYVRSVNGQIPINGNVDITIPDNQVNADWNAVSGKAQILNKPTIPSTPQEVGAMPADTHIPADQVPSDWAATEGVSRILNKPTIPTKASDIGALPDTTVIPNVEGFIKNEPNAFDYGNLKNKPTIPSIDGLATETYVDKKVAGIVDSAPDTLNTLNELATALGNDANFATTMATNIGKKVSKSGISNILYGTNSQGAEYNWNIIKEETLPTQDSAGNANVNGIPKYNYTHGTLSTNTPINDRDATNKKYVDTELNKKANSSGTYDLLVVGKAKELSTSDNTKVAAEGLNELNIYYNGPSFINYRGGSNTVYIGNGDGTDTRGTLQAGNIYSNGKLVLTKHQDISGKADITYVDEELSKKQNKIKGYYINDNGELIIKD